MGLHGGKTPSFSAVVAARAINGYDGPVGQCYKYRKLSVCDRQGHLTGTYMDWPGLVQDSRLLWHRPPGHFRHPLHLIAPYKKAPPEDNGRTPRKNSKTKSINMCCTNQYALTRSNHTNTGHSALSWPTGSDPKSVKSAQCSRRSLGFQPFGSLCECIHLQ